MKKVISGKMYNTETAKCVGYYDNGCLASDFAYEAERLFRKKTGEYFLHGEGGPMSSYAVSHGQETSGGEDITPLSESDAKAWAEKYLDGDEYEEIFGPVPE